MKIALTIANRSLQARLRAAMGLASIVVCLHLGDVTATRAQTISLETITFAAEHRGLELLGASGSGSSNDPYVVHERITGSGPAILTIRHVTASFGKGGFQQHGVGFSLVKVVENGTTQAWPSFEVELRENLDLYSDRLDGLSFGQATGADRTFSADRLPMIRSHREPYDGVHFSGGLVEPGERVVIRVVVTDYSPIDEFFLLQHQDAPIAELRPEPGHAAMAMRDRVRLLLRPSSLSSPVEWAGE